MRPNPALARRLRAESSEPERVLWSALRDRRLAGFKFRRQAPIGPYVVDFYCAATGVVVEVDGSHHAERSEEDDARTAWLERSGCRIFRCPTPAILGDRQAVLDEIADLCRERKVVGQL